MKKVLMIIIGLLMISSVLANHDDISVTHEDTARVGERFIFYHNITVHQNEEIGFGVEYENGSKEMIYSLTNPDPTDLVENNQKIDYIFNDTGNSVVFTYLNVSGDITYQYIDDINVKHAKIPTLGTAMLIITILLIILGLFQPLAFILALITMAFSLLDYIMTYWYVIGNIGIGLIGFVYILMILAVSEVTKQYF